MPRKKTNDFAIRLTNVCKKYTLHHEKPTLVENVLGRKRKEEFWALKDINLEIKRGERVGIIGPNGSGKTTLLEIVAGITAQTNGNVETKGKVVSLIELEAGFHPELTGEENVYLNGLLLGMSKEGMRRKYKKIVKFAGIGNFIDSPMYTYSEGMKLRLGFSVAIHASPDILVLDENLAVGDEEFQRKTFEAVREAQVNGVTTMVSSHVPWFIWMLADSFYLLSMGKLEKVSGSLIRKQVSAREIYWKETINKTVTKKSKEKM